MAEVTLDDVRHVAVLARIAFTDEELERLTQELQNILKWVDKLQELDTEMVEPAGPMVGTDPERRGDRVQPSRPAETWRELASWCDEEGFKVPRVVE